MLSTLDTWEVWFSYTWLFSFSIRTFSFTNPCYSFLSPCFCKLRHHHKYSFTLSSNFWTVFHFVFCQRFYIPPMNTTLFSNIITNVNDMVLLCLQNHNNVFLANGVKCWNLFTHSTKSSDSCFTIIYIRFVIQWPWVYNIFLFEWVHPENNVHQTEWSADGCIVIDKEWYYVYSYKLSQIA